MILISLIRAKFNDTTEICYLLSIQHQFAENYKKKDIILLVIILLKLGSKISLFS